MTSKRLFYGYFFAGTFCVLCYYFSGIEGVARFLGSVLVYFLVIYAFYWSFKSLGRSEPVGFIQFFIVYLYKLSVFLSVVLLLSGVFVYFQNNILPAKMPLYTLTNGEKTIKFQTMSHIAAADFYKNVQSNISTAKQEGFVLFYEGVGPGTAANKKVFDTAIGVEITPDLYESFSKVYGVSHQDNNDFLGIKNNKDFNVDLNIDTIVELFLEKIPEEERKNYQQIKKNSSLPGFVKRSIEEEGDDINELVLSRISQLNEKQLVIIRYINKSLLNFIIKHDSLRQYIVSKMDVQDIFSVILDDRNTHVVSEILTSKDDKIFVLYGLMHFDGIFEKLTQSDPAWAITETQYSYPISSPRLPWSL